MKAEGTGTVMDDTVTTKCVSVFDEPVRDRAVVLRAGRFRGYGLCPMMDEEGEDRE